jgi:hypothetical protein
MVDIIKTPPASAITGMLGGEPFTVHKSIVKKKRVTVNQSGKCRPRSVLKKTRYLLNNLDILQTP